MTAVNAAFTRNGIESNEEQGEVAPITMKTRLSWIIQPS